MTALVVAAACGFGSLAAAEEPPVTFVGGGDEAGTAVGHAHWNDSLVFSGFPLTKGLKKRRVVTYPYPKCSYAPLRDMGAAERWAKDNDQPFDPVKFEYVKRGCVQVPAQGAHPSVVHASGVNAFNVVVAVERNPVTDEGKRAQADLVRMMVEDAFTSVDLPAPQITTSPAMDQPKIVNLPTWWRVTNARAQTSPTVTAGPVSVSVRATPVATTWTPGFVKGQDVEPDSFCNKRSLGIDWVSETATPEDHPDKCSYTYRWPQGKETATVDVQWEIRYTITSPIVNATDAELPTQPVIQNAFDIKVFERHALVTR